MSDTVAVLFYSVALIAFGWFLRSENKKVNKEIDEIEKKYRDE